MQAACVKVYFSLVNLPFPSVIYRAVGKELKLDKGKRFIILPLQKQHSTGNLDHDFHLKNAELRHRRIPRLKEIKLVNIRFSSIFCNN